MNIIIELSKKTEILQDGLISTGDFTKYDIFEKSEIDSFWNKIILKASIDGILVGEAVLLPSRCSISWVNRAQILIYVKPEFCRKGIGMALMKELLNQAHITSCHYLWASIKSGNDASKALFKEFRFKKNGINPEFFDGKKLICNERWSLFLKPIRKAS